MEWNVSNFQTEQVLIGRPLLDAIGCKNRTSLSAACDRNDEVINVPEILGASRKIYPIQVIFMHYLLMGSITAPEVMSRMALKTRKFILTLVRMKIANLSKYWSSVYPRLVVMVCHLLA